MVFAFIRKCIKRERKSLRFSQILQVLCVCNDNRMCLLCGVVDRSYQSWPKMLGFKNLLLHVSAWSGNVLPKKLSILTNIMKSIQNDLEFEFWQVGTAMVISATSAATAIGLVARDGHNYLGWMAICGDFVKFCNKMTVAVILSYFSFVLYLLLTIISAKKIQAWSSVSHNRREWKLIRAVMAMIITEWSAFEHLGWHIDILGVHTHVYDIYFP